MREREERESGRHEREGEIDREREKREREREERESGRHEMERESQRVGRERGK